MASEPSAATRLADLWSLLHEGGLTIDTEVAGPGSPIALRTVVQADGDRIVRVAWKVLAPLPPPQRLLLAAAHHEAVQAHSVAVLLGLRRRLAVARALVLGLFGASEAYGFWSDRLPLHDLLDPGAWRTLLWQQRWNLALLIVAIAGPPLLRWIAPYVLRLLARGIIAERRRQARQASGDFLARLPGA